MASVVPRQVRQVSERFAASLRDLFGADVIDVRLFGSQARGEGHEDSDVDLFVVLREAGWAERRTVLDLAGDLWLETEQRISPTILDLACYRRWREQERPLVMDAERDGIVL
jgi:uncharacterized protein